MVNYPQSIPKDVEARAFIAKNRELGIVPEDCDQFLDACQWDGIIVLGWELWIVNHIWGDEDWPVWSPGFWCGGIPVSGGGGPAVFGGSGDSDETRQQLAAFDLDAEVHPEWLLHVRVNFTLSD